MTVVIKFDSHSKINCQKGAPVWAPFFFEFIKQRST